MGSFNWITFDAICPACQEFSKITAQTHMCSDYNGDGRGRFHDQFYKLGEKMWWWEKSDSRYKQWQEGDDRLYKNFTINDDASECCYSSCSLCSKNLYAIIKFVACTPMKLIKLGLENDWPEDYTA
jgi:hypothetical protein